MEVDIEYSRDHTHVGLQDYFALGIGEKYNGIVVRN